MKKLIVYLLLLLAIPASLLSQTYTVGATGGADYQTLKDAFDDINSGTIQGYLVLQIIESTNETSSAVLNASGSGSANYSSVIIYPTVTGKSISGGINNALINLNGADNVTIDGRLNGTGSSVDLTISNTNATTGASTILFIGSAENNTIKYCTLKGSGTNGARGVIFFSSSSNGNGNDGNKIENNNITNNDGSRPDNALFSLGAPGYDNSNNTVSNNNFYDFLRPNSGSIGIYLSTNNSLWTISGNSFYETAPFITTANVTYYIIRIASTGGSGFNITGNYIGGSSSGCTGSWSKTGGNNNFYAIDLNSGTGNPCNILNNTISNFNWTNSSNAGWRAIRLFDGLVNANGNIIGNDTGNSAIILTNGGTSSGGDFYGIEIRTAETVVIDNNKIGAITTGNTNNELATDIFGIYKIATAGTVTISNNLIGSTVTGNSINSSSESTDNAQLVRGIYNAGTGDISITGNTVANLANSTTNANTGTLGRVNGITSADGSVNIITDNTIHDLTISNANSNLAANASICGILLTGTVLRTVSDNIIYNLSNTNNAFTGGVTGLYFSGSTGGNTISRNFIHSLSVSSGSASASVYGIRIASGASTYANNIITLGGNSAAIMYGIYQTGGADNDNNLYFNTVYLAGSVASGTDRSYSLYSTGTANARDFTNNILVNERSTAGGTDLHFAMYIAAAGGTITCRNNDYFVSGTGGTLGNYGSIKTSLPIVTGQDQGSVNLDPGFAAPGGTAAANYIPSNNLLLGFSGTGITTDYAGTLRSETHPAMGAYEITVIAKVDVYKSAVYQASYAYLRDALYDINTGVLSVGDFEIRINANLTETASAILNASGSGGADYSSVTIFPTVTGLIIDGNFAAPLIDLNGATNVTIDGRPNKIGTAANLSLINYNNSSTAGTSAIRFINDAGSNVVKYCNIKASPSGTTSGIILFGTTTGTYGNDGNGLYNNNITVAADADRVINAIYSAGTAIYENGGNEIHDNNIYNFLNRSSSSNGIYIAANNTTWDISGNSFYETTPFIPEAGTTYYFIRIVSATGNNFDISQNYIGGRAPLCGGSALTKTNANDNVFFGIYVNTATGIANVVQNNTIRNINWSNATNAIWTAIQIAGGDASVGIPAGNNIGSATGNGSVTVTNTAGSTFYGIYLTSTGTVDCRNNNIGSITTANDPANATNMYLIYKSATAGTTTMSNNTIGSTSTLNSIYASSPSTASAQSVIGIYNRGTGNIDINDNTISNITNGTTNSNTGTLGEINGISSTDGINTIANNIIRYLTNGNANSNATNNSSVSGISLTGATPKNVIGNTILNLSNTYPSFTGEVIGIYFAGETAGNQVSENFIHSLSVSASSTAAAIYGIRIASGASTYSNNIINLGGNTQTTIYGIFETGALDNDNSLYFNTLYIGGAPTSGSLNSYSLYSATTNNNRNFRNNLLINERSNNGASGSHYAIRVQGAANLTIDYNDYYITGTGGILGYLGSNRVTLAAWQTATGQDANSLSTDPMFYNAGGSTATDYIPEETLPGIDGTGISIDFGLVPRVSPPTMGAWETSGNKWIGSFDTDWGTPENWSKGVVPAADANIQFHNAAENNLALDINRSVDNIINSTLYQVETSGNILTVKGSFIFTGGAQIYASDDGSGVEFAGTSSVPQTIPAGSFLDNEVFDLIINNPDNVTLDGTLILLNTLTVTSGRLDAVTNSPTFRYAGSDAQTIEVDQFLNERIYNLSIDNAAGVTLNTDFTIDNDLTISSGNLFTISTPRLLTVTNDITNDAGTDGFVIKSDAAGDAQLINSTPGVPATVELYLTGDFVVPVDVGRFHYFVPPVETMDIGEDVASVEAALGLTDFRGDLVRYVEANAVDTEEEGWWYHDNYPDDPPGFTTLESEYGYNIFHRSTSDILTFKGDLNALEHTFSLSYTSGNAGEGWNLIGNPFPCNYDLNGVEGLGTVVDGISNTIFYNNNGDYAYWNVFTNTGSTGGYTDIPPPMTGFFVLSSSLTPSSLVFPVEFKTAATSDPRSLHKGASNSSAKSSDITKVKLVLSNGVKTNETIALLFDDATDSYNEHYDAPKLFASGSTSPDIYIEKSGADYFMKAVKGPVTDPVIIPLKVVVKEAGSHTITATEFDNLNGTKVVLKHGAVETLLSQGSTYNFTSGAGTLTDFQLVFGDEIVTGVEQPEKGDFKTWYNNDAIYINSPDEVTSGISYLIIYDLQGKPVYNNRQVYLSPGETVQIPVNLRKGIYVMHISVGGKSFVSKIAVF